MNNQFSQRVSDIITYSKEEAYRLRNGAINPEHLLLGMLRDNSGKAIEILQKLNIDLGRIKKRLESFLKEDEGYIALSHDIQSTKNMHLGGTPAKKRDS